ncbi:heterokaryon incompatibility protein-domain-containing protein [Biscogniauxia sp. FL1348]|nr:heterokaryon incompatibility protein-domain-containing protein [Biscogniauxia sp. FL1348]
MVTLKPGTKVADKGATKEGSSRPSYMCERCWTGLFGDSVFHERIMRDCQKPFDHKFSYVTSWLDLQASSVDCHWCQLILSYEKTPRTKDEIKVDVAFFKRQDGWAIPYGTQFINVSVDGERHISGDIYAAPDDPAADYIVARPQLLDVNTPHAHSLVLRAIEDCIAQHECCPSPHDQFLPMRLIDCTDPRKPKLVETDGQKGRYIVLSYVWGEAQVHSTTSSNISSYLSGIDISVLPQTIQDAISLTKDLEFDYLWVDSLCIIQDSDEDKNKQIGQMRQIYNDAYLTIVAASATKVSEGFLQTRAPPIPPDTRLAFQLPGGKGVGTFYFYISIKNGEDQETYHPSMEPVSKRGWCLQEFMLAPRALVFTSRTVQYHCQYDVMNVGDSYHPTYIARPRFPDAVYAFSTDWDASSTTPPRISTSSRQWNAVHQGWSTALTDYTQRSITVPDDKLRAFAGVAELFHRARATAYLAGLWEDTLLEDLLWETQLDEGKLAPRPPKYRAPSWSWASIDSGVKSGIDGMYREYGEATWCKKVSCDVTLADADLPFDCVTAAVLVLHGAIFKTSLSRKEGRRLVYSLPPPERGASRTTVDDDPQRCLSKAQCIGTAYLDSSDDLHLEEVWALPMKWSEAGRSVNGLILAPAGSDTTDESGRRYRRVGYLRTSGFSPEDSHWVEWIKRVDTEDIVIV